MWNLLSIAAERLVKELRGLKLHQRRCRNIKGLTGDQLEPENSNFDTSCSLDESLASDHVGCISFDYQDTADTKPGVYLPKTSDQWAMANDFFKSTFVNIDFDLDNIDVDAILRLLNNSIYNYFTENNGTVRTNVDKELIIKYREYSPHSLKKALKCLKFVAAPPTEIQYVTRLLRSKLSQKSDSSNTISSISHGDHDRFISRNFWGFVKRIVERPLKILPSFSRKVYTEYFHKLFSSVSPNRQFPIPCWCPSLPHPTVTFSCEPPSYEMVTRVIRK